MPPRVATKQTPKPVAKPVPKTQTKPLPKAAPKPQPKALPKPQPKAQPKPKTQSKPLPKAQPPKQVPQQSQSWLTRTTNAAASSIGNFTGAIVSAAGNGVAGAGKGASSRNVFRPAIKQCHVLMQKQPCKHISRLG